MSVPTSCPPPATGPAGDLRRAHCSSRETTGSSLAPVCSGGSRGGDAGEGASFSRPMCALQHLCTDCRLVLFAWGCSLFSLCFSRISIKFNTQLLSWFSSAFLFLTSVSGGKLSPSCASLASGTGRGCATTPLFPVLPRAGGNSCCPLARKHIPLHGGAAPNVTALVWGLPYISLGTISCIINQGEQHSPALQEG